MNKDARIHIRITEEKKKSLSEFAKKNNMTLSAFILNAIEFYIYKGYLNVGFKKEK